MYVLGELSQVQREEYEEHYFDCAECAIDLKALATFADTTREVLRQEKSRAPKMAVTRGGEEVKLSVRPNESLPLKFDFTPTPSFDAYVCQLQDEAGRSVLQVRVPGSFTNKELNLVIPANRIRPGKYTLVFTGDPGAKGQPTKDEVLRLSFAVEFLP